MLKGPVAEYKEMLQRDFAEAWEALYSPNWEDTKTQELARRTGELVIPNCDRIQKEVPSPSCRWMPYGNIFRP